MNVQLLFFTIFLVLFLIVKHYLDYGGLYLGDVKDTEDFKYVTFKELPQFTAAHKSLMAKHLTPEIFNKLKNKKVFQLFFCFLNYKSHSYYNFL